MTHPLITHLLLIFRGSVRLFKFLFSITAGIILIATVAGLSIYFYFARDLPDIRTLEDYRPPVISEAYSNDDTKIGEFWTECRIFVPFDKIPKRVMQAFIDSEDARFFEHKGVDMRSIFRAFVANLKAGEITQGGSTITQQITRSLLLSRERTVTRKIREAILATRLERHLSKEQILTLYLNQIYLGNRSYGVASAARNYFHLDVDELSLAQIALIAGLPTAPTTFSPINSPIEARKRQMHVLGRMVEEGHITPEEATAAADAHFPIFTAGIDKTFIDKDAAYFTEHVRRIVKERYGDEVLYHKGLKIYTTVDLPMQRAATAALRAGVEKLDRRHGWRGPIAHIERDQIAARAKQIEAALMSEQLGGRLISWPPSATHQATSIQFKPGQIYEAIVTDFQGKDTFIQIGNVSGVIKHAGLKWARKHSTGWLGYEGNSYVSDPKKLLSVGDVVLARRLEDGTFQLAQIPGVQSALIAATPQTGAIRAMVGGYDFAQSEFNRATQALRQPGSSFKPFVYAAALDKGYTFDTTIVDEPVVYQVGRNSFWSPKNYGGKHKGPTPFRNCLTFSRNVPTVKITFDIGTHYLTAFERKMGITSQVDKYLSMALGANSVYLQEMVQAYTIFVNHGRFSPLIAITRIEDAHGNILESAELPKETPIASSLLKGISEADRAKQQEILAQQLAERQNVNADELNTELFELGVKHIAEDSLILTDLELKTLYGAQIPEGHVMTPQTAYLMVQLLKGVVEGGTGARVRALGKPAGGKTGTTNDETDVWFIGFVPDLVAGVWVGFDELKKIGRGIAGGNTAAPIFLDFMKVATEGWEAKDFPKPDSFPHGAIASMTGGSAIFGARPTQSFGPHGGTDRAGEFFEEDLEYFDEPPAGYDEPAAIPLIQ